jgi:hypothetical protein
VIPANANRHAAGLQLHHEEDYVPNEAAHGQDFNGEEVGRCEAIPMSRKECLQGMFAPRCGAGSMP